jgi:hypothetical protein
MNFKSNPGLILIGHEIDNILMILFSTPIKIFLTLKKALKL